MRFIIVSVLSVLVVALILVGLRLYGLARPHYTISHKFFHSFEQKPQLIAYRGWSSKFPENTLAALKMASAKKNTDIFFIDVRQTKDGHFVLMADPTLEHITDGQGRVEDQTLAEIKKLKIKETPSLFSYKTSLQNLDPRLSANLKPSDFIIPTLEDVFLTLPSSRFILNIQSNEKNIDKRIVKIIKKHKMGDQVLIQSNHDVVIHSIKKLQPRWLFGSGQTELTKLQILEGIWIETLAPLKSDVLVSTLYPFKTNQRRFSSNLIKEIHRRKMKIILGPIVKLEDMEFLKQEGVDGILTPFL